MKPTETQLAAAWVAFRAAEERCDQVTMAYCDRIAAARRDMGAVDAALAAMRTAKRTYDALDQAKYGREAMVV